MARNSKTSTSKTSKSKIRKGDTVVVIAGNDRGQTGTVKRVYQSAERVLVDGVNMRWHHKKPTEQSPKGDRSQAECPVHISNVMLWDEAAGKGVRKRPEKA